MALEKHPDNNIKFTGLFVPNWDIIKTEITNATLSFPFLKYIAWDIALTPDGYKVLEINNVAGLGSIQVHKPALQLPVFKENYSMLFQQ